MKKIISVLMLALIIISVPVTANAMTDKEKQEIEEIKKNNEKIMQQMEETKKQSQKAMQDAQKQLEGLKNKSANKAATANKSVPDTVKFKSNDYSKYIPKKDNWKISWIPKKLMDDNELKKYLKDIHSKVEHAISKQAKSNAEQIIQDMKNKYNNDNAAIANAANGCWITKHPEEALYIMGVACNNDPADANNLNNYSAFLTMSGAPEKAIPILNKLNNQYPNNSTVLNNLGQAWFDLGDTQEAEKYLDSAIKAFAYHSQANYTKAIIEAARGDQTQAIASMKKSIKLGYSKTKEDTLIKLGGKLDESDLNFPMPQDPLGLEKFVLPPYPQGVGDIRSLSKKWEEFRQQCSQKRDELYAQEVVLRKKLEAEQGAKTEEAQQALQNFNINKIKKVAYAQYKDWPPFYAKAMAKLRIERDEFGGWDEAAYKKHKEQEAQDKQALNEIDALKEQLMQGNPSCGDINNYIKQANAKYETRNTEYIEKLRKKINTQAYYLQYAEPGGDTAVELRKVLEKEEFIGSLQALPVILYDDVATSMSGCSSQTEGKKGGGKLADFYDLHCDNKSELIFPGVGSINIACNKMETEITVLPIIKGKWTENLDTNTLTNGTVLLGVSTGIGAQELGPLKAEAKIGGGAFIEFDNNGITDFGPFAELKGSLGVNWEKGTNPYKVDIKGTSVSIGDLPSLGKAGIQARWGWNSGFSAKGTGILKGAF